MDDTAFDIRMDPEEHFGKVCKAAWDVYGKGNVKVLAGWAPCADENDAKEMIRQQLSGLVERGVTFNSYIDAKWRSDVYSDGTQRPYPSTACWKALADAPQEIWDEFNLASNNAESSWPEAVKQ